ncbi:hypothetical protein ACHAPT_000944 [Fusarium lateritium]
MAGGIRGRPPGLPGKKRKAEHELSNNPLTKKVRDRRANLTNEQRLRENRRNSMYQAIRRARIAPEKQPSYIAAGDAEKAALREASKQEVEAK